jgi:hypothetical protein
VSDEESIEREIPAQRLQVSGTERQNKIIGVAGRKGSGKSTIARKILEHAPRLFLFDTMGEHAWVPERMENLQEAVMWIMETPYRDSFMGSIVPSGDDFEAEFSETCVEVYDAGNMLFGVEEVPMLSTAGFIPKKYNKVVRLGRHRNLSLLYTAQRLSECPRALTSATDIFVLFCHSEPRDLDAIADRCGREISEKVQELGDHGFLIWDVLERRERPIEGDWYSLIVSSGSRVNPL